MKEKVIARLLSYLNSFGQARFEECDFSNPLNIRYARMDLVTTAPMAEGLEAEINSQLTGENGIPAFIRFIDIKTLRGGKIRYVAEVVPREHIPKTPEEMTKATEIYLQRLPKVIKNYRHKHRCD